MPLSLRRRLKTGLANDLIAVRAVDHFVFRAVRRMLPVVQRLPLREVEQRRAGFLVGVRAFKHLLGIADRAEHNALAVVLKGMRGGLLRLAENLLLAHLHIADLTDAPRNIRIADGVRAVVKAEHLFSSTVKGIYLRMLAFVSADNALALVRILVLAALLHRLYDAFGLPAERAGALILIVPHQRMVLVRRAANRRLAFFDELAARPVVPAVRVRHFAGDAASVFEKMPLDLRRRLQLGLADDLIAVRAVDHFVLHAVRRMLPVVQRLPLREVEQRRAGFLVGVRAFKHLLGIADRAEHNALAVVLKGMRGGLLRLAENLLLAHLHIADLTDAPRNIRIADGVRAVVKAEHLFSSAAKGIYLRMFASVSADRTLALVRILVLASLLLRIRNLLHRSAEHTGVLIRIIGPQRVAVGRYIAYIWHTLINYRIPLVFASALRRADADHTHEQRRAENESHEPLHTFPSPIKIVLPIIICLSLSKSTASGRISYTCEKNKKKRFPAAPSQ